MRKGRYEVTQQMLKEVINNNKIVVLSPNWKCIWIMPIDKKLFNLGKIKYLSIGMSILPHLASHLAISLRIKCFSCP